MNYIMHSGYFYLIVLFFPLIGNLLNKLYFDKYIFNKSYMNFFLVFNMFFGSPIGILSAIAFSGMRVFKNNITDFDILKFYASALIIIILIGIVKYFSWYVFFNQDKNNLLIYSKKFTVQMPFLTLWLYPWWILHDMDFALGLVPTLIVSEIVIIIYIVTRSIYKYILEKIRLKNSR